MSVAGTLASNAAAASGSYQVSACNYAPEGINNSWTWSTTDTSEPPHYAEHANCPYRLAGSEKSNQEGGLSTTDELGLSSGAAPETGGGWTFTAPVGTTITGITYERYLGHENDTSNTWSPALRADGTIVAGQTCAVVFPSVGCVVGGPPGEAEPASISGLAAHQLTFGTTCQAPSKQECVTGATQHEAWAAMYGARVTLSDPAPPTLDVPSGALWEPGAYDGFHKGTESGTVSAEDVGGGVKSIVLSADGVPVETYEASCDFTKPVPCPLSTGPWTLTLPTTELSDGTHTLTLVATDAAGNESAGASDQITVANNPPPAPVGLSATETAPGGSIFTATWSDPAGQVAPISAAAYQVCPASGSGACGTPVAAPAGGPATVTVPGPGSWTLSVWLTNAAGNGSEANAARTTLTYVQRPCSCPDMRKVPLHVTEALHGRKLVVTVIGPSTGTVRVSYTGRYRGRLIASRSKKASLHHGKLIVTFKLSKRVAAHATIRVSARLDHRAPVTSTLRRPSHRRRKAQGLWRQPTRSGG
ncbi:MAG: Ig-like domain-containing protein [Solirubrobacteraceae bacterium]